MAIADKASVVTMPPEVTHLTTVLDFLCWQFSAIPRNSWQARMQAGRVHWADGSAIDENDLYAGHQRIFYYREVEQEPVIPFKEQVLFQNEHILVACKPHFLPVTPGGQFVQECLVNRLRQSTGIKTLSPVHRIDRETAGLVLLSINPETRADYHQLFARKRIHKSYLAAVHAEQTLAAGQQWQVRNRMEQATERFRMTIAEGAENSHSVLTCLDQKESKALFQLQPVTGKRHQLRVHMSSLGMPLVNDRYYPELQPRSEDDYDKPLQLLAKTLEFSDPITGQPMAFKSERSLKEADQLALL